MKRILFMSLWVLFVTNAAMADELRVYSGPGPRDPLAGNRWVEELGPTQDFRLRIGVGGYSWTSETAAFDGSDNPDKDNALVTITNRHEFPISKLIYVADWETNISNWDAKVGNYGENDAWYAFWIDSVGVNRPLVFESMTVDNIFEPDETWKFIIQDYSSSLGYFECVPGPDPPYPCIRYDWIQVNPPPNAFDSTGIGFDSDAYSDLYGDSSGSIITPEPATVMLLGIGSLALIRRKR